MESHLNPQDTSKTDFFEELTRKIEGHLSYLLHHFKYLTQIEKKLIPENKIKDYFNHVLSFEIEKEEWEQHIPTIKKLTEDMLKFCQRLIGITRAQNIDHALAYTYVFLEQALRMNSIKRKIANSKKLSKFFSIYNIFDEHDFLKTLQESIEAHLPPFYPTLARYLKLENRISDQVSLESGTRYTKFDVDLIMEWSSLYKNIASQLQKIEDLKKAHPSFSSNILNQKGEIDSALLALRDKIKNTDVLCGNDKEHDHAVLMIIADFDNLYPLLVKLETLLEDLRNFGEDQQKLVKLHKNLFPKILDELTKLNKKYKQVFNQLNNVSQQEAPDAELNNSQQSLQEIKKQLDEMNSDWGKKGDEKFKSKDEFLEKLAAFHENRDQIFSQLEKVQKNLVVYIKNKRTIAEKEKIGELENIGKQCNEELESKNERAQFFAERDKAYQEYKQQVQQKRDEKKKQKQLEQAALLAAKTNEPEKNTIIYKNESMEELILKLSEKQLGLLKAILNQEESLLYDDVCNLITNHLGGKITEIGNGSSHKRVEINKYFVEILVSPEDNKSVKKNKNNKKATADNQPPVTGTVSTGGMFKPHKEGHNSRKLYGFNVELIKQTFDQAKITLASIAELEKRKASGMKFS